MFDFVKIKSKIIDDKKKVISVYPAFQVRRSQDLMTKGRSFYAIWDEDIGLWSLDENRACELIDREIDLYAQEIHGNKPDYDIHTMKLLDYKSRQYTEWQSYCKAIPDNYVMLDTNITFANDEIGKEDYRSKRLNYIFDGSPTPNYEELISTLYDEEERRKIEWAIGSIIAGDSKDIQKFYVFYGEPGSGKSTILKVIKKLFAGYCTTFDARALGNVNAAFALEPFKNNPLIAIQDDGDLYHIEDNTRINSIASHEELVINEKHKTTYSARFNTVMFLGTNKPVRITDAKSGIIRRLIDITPSGHKLKRRHYDAVMRQIDFELGGIAHHCYEVYTKLGSGYYDTYKPINMMGITNDFYNFMEDNLDFFVEHKDRMQVNRAWQKYKDYVIEANIQYPFTRKAFKEEIKNYFDEYAERRDGERQVLLGFQQEKFYYDFKNEEEDDEPYALTFDQTESLFDRLYSDYPAQYANKDGKPLQKWDEVTTKLADLDTHKLHYALLPEEHIVIDFDIKNEKGEKDFELNLAAASKWPPTYAELSKSGAGIHLHYIYTGDPSQLSRIFDEDIEIKVFTGKSSLRRCLTKCNNLPIAKISSGLPLKGGKTMVNFEALKNEKQLRALINNCLDKKHHGATKPEVDYIYDSLEKAYASGMHYDVTDMKPDIQSFALNSTNQALTCLQIVSKMKWKSEEPSESKDDSEAPIIFYDCEVFPNLFIICWKYPGENATPVKMINPSPSDVEELFKYRMIGFNCRRYDNHILYARSVGYSNEELFTLSSRIVNSEKRDSDRNCFFSEAYNLSYTDVYDYSSKKQSLKKWEIELGLHHIENEFPWDQPVDEKYWDMIADYCVNDVIATEKVHEKLTPTDFKARLILAELSGLTPNDTTNNHTTRLIVGNDRNPQDKFIYTDLSEEFPGYRYDKMGIPKEEYLDEKQIVNGKSIYMGEDPSEGGYVYAEPGMYTNVALLDVASLHPTSAIILKVFGEEYTKNFEQLKLVRINVKHKDFDKAKEMYDGKLAKFLTTDEDAADLAYALKIAINSVYGLTSAKFPNKLKDPRNIDNIVAKRGALFMINLKHEVQNRGFKVAHIKTDSIKIPDATPEIIQFVMDYGKKYGYDFEHEETYSKMCLVNDAVYIAKYSSPHYDKKDKEKKHPIWWTATGAEFQVPYVFKTLFSHDPIEFKDYCETKSVSKGSLYLDMNEFLPEGEHNYMFIGRVGEFIPMAKGCGAGILYRVDGDKYYAAAGTKGYRFMDPGMVKDLAYENNIDKLYFEKLINDAIEHISEFGDYEWFVSDDDERVEVPFEEGDKFPMNPPTK